MGIDTALCSGCYENEYEVGDCCISHEEVIELIENVRSEDTGSCRFGSPEDESEDEEASEQFHKIPVLRQELHRIHMPRRH